MFAALVLVGALAWCRPAAAIQFDPTKMIGLDEIHPGMKGVARTVFQGTQIEEFQVEVLSVIRNFSSAGDVILIQCHGEKVEHTGIAAGMSGSPVYLEGRLAGAIAMSWPFSKDAVGGVTPIQQMIHATEIPAASRRSELDPAPAYPGARATPVPLLLGLNGRSRGLAPFADSILAALGARVVEAGPSMQAASTSTRTDLVPGAAVAIKLVTGDLDLSAVGTVTYREGDEVLCFGHPLFSIGSVSLPMGGAYVHTVLSSELVSSKMASPGETQGALTEDRAYAVRGRLGTRADMLPVALKLTDEGGVAHDYHYQVMRHPAYTASLSAMALLDGIGGEIGSMPRMALPYTATVFYSGNRTFQWEDQPVAVSGSSPSMDVAREVATRVNLLLNNSWGPAAVDSIRVEARVSPGGHIATIENAWVLKPKAHPGDRVGVAVRIRPERGESRVEEIELELPAHMPAGKYRVLVGDSDSRLEAERARAPGVFRANNLEDAVQLYRLKATHAAIYATLYSDDIGASARGEELPGLPGGTLAVLDDGRINGGVQWVRSRRWAEAVHPIALTVSGSLELNLNVESEGP